ncbi:MAG: FAD:protein FMN transferase [Acidobacteriota bacterium]
MGSFLDLNLFGEDQSVLREVTREAFHLVRMLERQMSIHLAESEVSFVNAYASRRSLRVEKGLFELLGAAVWYGAMTEGAFDITVRALTGRRTDKGRRSANGAELREDPLPQGDSGQPLRLNTRKQSVRFARPGVRIDLGGIAKGYAVDRIIDLLRRRGVASALVNFGSSSLYGLGTPPGRRFWQVPLMNPIDQGKQLAVARLVNQSLSSPGNYLSGRESFAENFHVVDPATGLPNRDVLGAAVVAPFAVESEAFSTAIWVMGCPRARDVVRARKGVSALVFERCSAAAGVSVVDLQDDDTSSFPFRIRSANKWSRRTQ